MSTLAAIDPEAIDGFDNCAFDEMVERSTLDIRTRVMAQFTASSAGRPCVRSAESLSAEEAAVYRTSS